MCLRKQEVRRKEDELLLLLLFDIVKVTDESIKEVIKKLDDCILPWCNFKK